MREVNTMVFGGKCPHCGAPAMPDRRKCPACGAPNENYVEHRIRRSGVPKTLDEMKRYCAVRGLPLKQMQFFIGEDYREPRAFGICRVGGEWIVYKNGGDGTRLIRYRGADEAIAVEEIFGKLLDECHRRGLVPENMKETV